MVLSKRRIEEVREQREQLLSGEWLTMDQVQQDKLISEFIDGYVLPPLSVFCPTIFRARQNIGEELFSQINELLAPPAEAVTRLGRLNQAYTPTLYLAGTAFSAVAETRAPRGSVVSVLACRMKREVEPFTVAPLAMTRLRGSPRTGPMSQILTAGPLGNQWFADILQRENLTEQWLLQDETIGALLVADVPVAQQQALYRATNHVRDYLYRTFPDYEGVQYPSILVRRTSPNIALDKMRWRDVEPAEVWVLRVDDDIAHRPYRSSLATQSLIKFGVVQGSGEIRYQSTSTTLLQAWNDFKQKHGQVSSGAGPPTLVRPFTRYRISYGLDLNRRVYDFLPPDW